MPKSLVCKVGVAQILANPAYADEMVSYIQEPTFPGEGEKVGLFSIAGLEEVNALKQRVSEKYIQHLNRKLDAFIRFAAARGVEILVFPEYAVPPESLPLCRQLADELRVAIIAGSHVVTLSSAAQQVYRQLDLLLERAAPPTTMEDRVQQAVCVVFVPGRKPISFSKFVGSKWESTLIPGSPTLHSFEMPVKAGTIEVQVLICIEALVQSPLPKEKHGLPRLIAIPASTHSCENFYQVGDLALLQGKCTLFANMADFGGSKIFARAENVNLWFTERNGTSTIPQHSEALLILEADLEKQFEVRKSTQEHRAVLDVRVYPTLYPTDSSECRSYADVVGALPPMPSDLIELSKRIEPFTQLTSKVFPNLLQNKLQHFVGHVVTQGAVSPAQAKGWVTPLIVNDIPSTDILRWELCREAIDTIHEIQLSGKHTERTRDLGAVYSHLLSKRNELMAFIQPTEKSEPPRKQLEMQGHPSPGESPFIDRQHAFDKIGTFINQLQYTAFVLSGMKGIGKSSLVQEAFRHVIPPRKKIWLQLTDGIAYPRFLAEFAYRCNLRIPYGLEKASQQQLKELEQRILVYLCQGPGAIVVLDEFQYTLNAAGEFEDGSLRELIRSLVDLTRNAVTKYIFISHMAPRFGPDLESRCMSYSLRGLDPADTRRLLLYWFQFGRDDLTGQFPAPSDRFLALLAGHPLATKFAARLWGEHPSADISKDIAIFEKLRDTIVPFILEKISLSDVENDLLMFASIFRLPVAREVFIRWKGNEANFLLDSLASQYLVESSEAGYQLHPLVRDFFYHKLTSKDAIAHHKTAARFFDEKLKKAKLAGKPVVPENLGEAVHHYLAAGDWHAVHTLAIYKEELRPVARSHYRKKEYALALRDYLVLIDLDKDDAEAFFHLALLYARRENWEEAELYFDKARTLRPKASWILQGFASAKLRASKLAEAEALLSEAEEINPNHSPTLVEIGHLKELQGDFAAAEDYYRKAIDAGPDNSFAYFRLAKFLYRQDEIPEAYELARAAVATNPLDEYNKSLVSELKKKMGEGE